MTQATLDRFKLPPAAMHFLVPLFLSCAMSCIVSLISTLRSLGFGDFELVGWLLSWMLSWAIAFPCVLIILPIARKLALKLVKQ